MDIKAWMLAVKKIASRYRYRTPRHMDEGDLCQEGLIALLNAEKRYKPNTGVPFAAFASIRVRGAMMDVLRDNYYIPRETYKKHKKIHTAIAELHKHQDFIEPAEIAEQMNLTLAEYDEITRRIQCRIEIEDECSYEFDPLQILIQIERIDLFTNFMNNLGDRDKQIANMYFRENKCMKEIGNALGIGESRVSQLVKDIIESMEGMAV